MIDYSLPIGQDKVINFLKNAKNEGRLASTFIFEGDEGIGKKTLAKYFSMILMCDNSDPCLECNNCRFIIKNSNIDVITVSNENAASIGINKVREIIKEASIKPSISNKKIFIIDNAHLLTKEAQNALLKIIEEPPSYAVFILLCENTNLILKTVLSRAVIIKIPPLKNEYLTQITGCNDELLIDYSMGNAGKLIKLLNNDDFKTLRNGFFEVMLNLLSDDEYNIYKIYDFFDEKKDNKNELIEMTITFFRDILFYKNSCNSYIINKDKLSYIEKFSQKLTRKKCENICENTTKTQNELGKYGGFLVNVHSLLIRIREEIYD